MKLLWRHTDVDADLERYWLHLARARGAELADQFLADTEIAFRELQAHPALGRLGRWDHPRLDGIRSWPVSRRFRRWLIFYRETPSAVEIVRVLHGTMNLAARLLQPPE